VGNFGRYFEEVEKSPAQNDPFPEADVAVIIMNRFVIKPVLVPPTKHNQLVGDSVPAPSNTPDHQHDRQMDQALLSAGDQCRILYDRPSNVQIVRLDHVPASATSRFGPTTRPYPIRPSAMLDNLNSELVINRGQPEGQTG